MRVLSGSYMQYRMRFIECLPLLPSTWGSLLYCGYKPCLKLARMPAYKLQGCDSRLHWLTLFSTMSAACCLSCKLLDAADGLLRACDIPTTLYLQSLFGLWSCSCPLL